MGEEAVVAEVDAKAAEDEDADGGEDQAGPAEEPGQDGEQGDEVIDGDGDSVRPDQSGAVDRGGEVQVAAEGAGKHGFCCHAPAFLWDGRNGRRRAE